MLKCANCGAECADSTKFCQNCGAKIPQNKECPACHAEAALAAKFCPECGYRFNAGGGAPGSLAIGDKNVIAGDVVGRQENIKVAGPATIVKNEDETRKMVKCHVCGRNIPITRSVDCPVCGETTCESCFDASRKSCVACISKENANREEVYLNALRKALEDGVMTLAKRQELNALQRELGITAERASELENLTKKGAKAAKDTSTLSSYVRLSLQKALDVLYDEGDAQKAYDDLLPIYRRYSGNEEVLIGFLNAAVKVNRQEAFDIIRKNQADVAGMHLVCIDSDLENGELASADERLTAATRLWPDDLLIKCRRIMCLVAMYDKLQDGLFLKQAAEILSSLPEPQNKLESSWVCRVRNAVRKGMGEKADRITRAYCREHDLYFAVAGGGQDPDELYQQAREVRETDPKLYVKLLAELAEGGHVEAQFMLGLCYKRGHGIARDYGEAVKWYRKAAEQNYASAQNNLGSCYANAHGVARDYGEAVKWYRKAAEQNYASAQDNLGVCYHDGLGVDRDYGEAVKWFRKAAEQNCASAQNGLGSCYANGQGVTRDYGEAVKWFRKSAEQGNSLAQNWLGFCYDNGYGVDRDYGEAVKWYRKAAEQGNAASQNNLGACYANGQGVTRDYGEAVKWFRKSADQDNSTAQNWLGVCYEHGRGVEQNHAEAVKWYRKAAEQNFSYAQNNLGMCFEYARGVSQDYVEAVKWYRKAAEQGYHDGQNNLGRCYQTGNGVSQDYGEAVKWYRKAAEQGNKYAQNNLGVCYYRGWGVPQSYAEAVKWYRKAADQGHVHAQYNLGYCHEYGQGVEQNAVEAAKWYRKAAGKYEEADKALKRLESATAKSAEVPAAKRVDPAAVKPAAVAEKSDRDAAIRAMTVELEKMLLRIHDEKIFVGDDIDQKKLNNAIKAYAPNLDPKTVVVQVDDTVWGSAKEGCLITESEIYVKDINGKHHCPFDGESAWGLKRGVISSSLTLDGDVVFEFTQAEKDSMEKLVVALQKMCELHKLMRNS